MPAIWEMVKSQGKVAILVPHSGRVSMKWMEMMRSLESPNSFLITTKGYPLDVARDYQVNQALDSGADWLFFLDSDVIVPKNIIPVFTQLGLPIISGMYTAKRAYPNPLCWTMWGLVPNPTKEALERHEYFAAVVQWEGRNIEVDVVGTGCLMVHRSVFEAIRAKFPKYPYFLWTRDRHPGMLDLLNLEDEKMRYISEDFWFCMLAKKCGFKIIVDTACKCIHEGDVEFEDLEARISGA
jgi:hypothetical protein